jgi:ubiquinone/menaquinone biosynthesis C-methylase UbiE
MACGAASGTSTPSEEITTIAMAPNTGSSRATNMYSVMGQYYYRAQIWLLRTFKPEVLFDRINRLDWYRNTLRRWIDAHRFVPDTEILEVGCASGALTAYIASQGCIPTGVDYSGSMVELARTTNADISFAVADVRELPFGDEDFDAVVAASLINIVPEKEKAVSELARTCRKGGVVSILVPSDQFGDVDLAALQASAGQDGFSSAAMEAWHRLAPKMKTDDVVSLFEGAGLADLKTKRYLSGMVIAVSATKPR